MHERMFWVYSKCGLSINGRREVAMTWALVEDKERSSEPDDGRRDPNQTRTRLRHDAHVMSCHTES